MVASLPRASGRMTAARAVPAGGQAVCVGGMGMVVLLGLLAPADARGRGVDEEAVGLPGRLTPAEDRGRGVDEDGVGAGCEEQA